MKKINLFYLALATIPLFTACSEELTKSEEPAEGTPVTFTIGEGGAVTRTVTTEETAGYKTVFTADEAVGIYATGAASATNAQFTVNAEGNKLESNTPITIANTGTADFKAYSPYQSAVTDTYQFTVKSDQTTADNFNASNLLTATCAGVTASSPTVSFTFQPRLAIVRVEMAGAEGVNTSAVTLNAKPQVTWTAATDALSEAEGTATDIKMWHQNATAAASVDAATNQLFAAFVPAQQIEAGTSFLTMAVGDKQYRFKPKSAFTLSAGKINKFRVTIGENGEITIESITIDVKDWEVNDLTNIEGDLEEIEPEPEPAPVPIELISVADGTPTASNVTALDNRANATTTGWYTYIKSDYSSYITTSFDETSSVYKLDVLNASAWNHRGLCYRVDDTKISASTTKKFKLTIKASATIASGTANLRVCVVNASDYSNFYAFDGLKVNDTSFGITSDMAEYSTLTIDFNTFGKWTDNSLTQANLSYNNVLIYITGSQVATYYIESISLTEVL